MPAGHVHLRQLFLAGLGRLPKNKFADYECSGGDEAPLNNFHLSISIHRGTNLMT